MLNILVRHALNVGTKKKQIGTGQNSCVKDADIKAMQIKCQQEYSSKHSPGGVGSTGIDSPGTQGVQPRMGG